MNQHSRPLLLVALLVIMGCQSTRQTDDAVQYDEASPRAEMRVHGGKVVDGLQIQLWTEKQVWTGGEVPELKANAIVVSEGKLGFVDPPLCTSLECDGTRYHIPAAGALSTGGPPVRGSIYELSVILKSEYYRDSEDRPLVLTPGRHTIRLIILAQPPEDSTATPNYVYSNPVEIVVGRESSSS